MTQTTTLSAREETMMGKISLAPYSEQNVQFNIYGQRTDHIIRWSCRTPGFESKRAQ